MLNAPITRISRRLVPAPLTGEVWGVIAYFNPTAYGNKLRNLRIALASLRNQGLKVLVVEGALDGHDFVVTSDMAERIVQLQIASVLWQKERLLNIGIKLLPKECDRVIWLDGDVLFSNHAWVSQTADLLTQFAVVQPFHRAFWLTEGHHRIPDTTTTCGDLLATNFTDRTSSGSAFSELHDPSLYFPKGHTGFAWGARRNILLRCPLYDRLVLGGGDTFIVASMYGLSAKPLLERYCSVHQQHDISGWSHSFHQQVQGSVGYCAGDIFHLWHGARADRKYEERHRILIDTDFDPLRDISCTDMSPWRWSTNKPHLHQLVKQYFASRREGD